MRIIGGGNGIYVSAFTCSSFWVRQVWDLSGEDHSAQDLAADKRAAIERRQRREEEEEAGHKGKGN